MNHTLSERPNTVALPRQALIMRKRNPEKTLTSSVTDANAIEKTKSWFLDASRHRIGNTAGVFRLHLATSPVQRVSGRSGFGRRIEFLTSARPATTHEWSI